MDLQTGDIVFYKGNGTVPSLISFFTKSKFTHCSMVLYDDYVVEADWYKVANIVKLEYLKDEIEVYRFKGGLTAKEKIDLISFANTELGKIYGYPQILEYIVEYFLKVKFFKNPLESKHMIICSGLIDSIYCSLGINLVEYRDNGNVTPADLSGSPLIERIY